MRRESNSDGDAEMETVKVEDDGGGNVNSKRSLAERRSCEEAPGVHCVTLKQPHRLEDKTSPPAECCEEEVCEINCTDNNRTVTTPQGSIWSRQGNDLKALEAVAISGGYGEVGVKNNSGDSLFSNKIYTAPITVVNQVGENEKDINADSGSFKGQLSKKELSAYSYMSAMRSVTDSIGDSTERKLLTAFYLLVVLSLTIVLISYSSRRDDVTASTPPPSIVNDQNIYLNKTRLSEWKAVLPPPVNNFITSPTHVLPLVCTRHVFCSLYTRMMQRILMENNLRDNYITTSGSNGALYLGRGAHVEGEHTPNYNTKSLGIIFIGDYNKRTPNQKQIHHVKMLIAKAVWLKKFLDKYKLTDFLFRSFKGSKVAIKGSSLFLPLHALYGAFRSSFFVPFFKRLKYRNGPNSIAFTKRLVYVEKHNLVDRITS